MKLKFIIAVFLGSSSYGVLSTIVKLSYEQRLTTPMITLSQFIIGWLILFALMNVMKRNCVPLTKKQILQLMIAGAPTGLVGIFYYLSLVSLQASIAIILLFQFVWIGVILHSVLQKTLPNKKAILSITILLIGTFFASGTSIDSFNIDSKGLILGLLAAVSFALFILANERIEPSVPPLQRSFYMVTGSLFVVVIVFFPQLHIPMGSIPFQLLGLHGLLLGLFGVVIPPFLFAYGMPRVGSATGSILGAVELPVAVICSTVILNETVSSYQWVGVILILTAIFIPNMKPRRKAELESENLGS